MKIKVEQLELKNLSSLLHDDRYKLIVTQTDLEEYDATLLEAGKVLSAGYGCISKFHESKKTIAVQNAVNSAVESFNHNHAVSKDFRLVFDAENFDFEF